jgi:hypothetical protein
LYSHCPYPERTKESGELKYIIEASTLAGDMIAVSA